MGAGGFHHLVRLRALVSSNVYFQVVLLGKLLPADPNAKGNARVVRHTF